MDISYFHILTVALDCKDSGDHSNEQLIKFGLLNIRSLSTKALVNC